MIGHHGNCGTAVRTIPLERANERRRPRLYRFLYFVASYTTVITREDDAAVAVMVKELSG